MKKYFKRRAESDLGEGTVFVEFTDGWASRQVEIYGEEWRGADEKRNEWLADQPLEVVGLGVEDEIEASEW